MTNETLTAAEQTGAALVTTGGINEKLSAKGIWHVECFDSDKNKKWEDVIYNIVVNQGKNDMLDKYFAGSAYTATWYMSLITAGVAISTSTYTAPTVTEITAGIITSNVRPTVAWSAAATGSKSATTTAFTVTGTATVTGNMLVAGSNAVGNTASLPALILFSSGAFAAGSKNISSGDTLNVTYSIAV